MTNPASPYLGLIRQASAKRGVPADLLAAQIQAESGFNPNARSPAGAEGISQFMPGTAKGFGIDPFNPSQAIDAQARYDSNLYKQFGSWPLALAGYNAGAGAVAKYGGIPPYAETRNYVKSIMASRSRFPGLAAGGGPAPPPAPPPTLPPTGVPRTANASQPGGVGVSAPVAAPDLTPQLRSNLLQSLLYANADTAGVPAITLPQLPQIPAATPALPAAGPVAPIARTAAPAAATPRAAAPTTRVGAYDLPLASRKVIGTPYAGTHTLGNWESDNAIDLATPVGSPVYATQNGVIGTQFGSLGASSGSRFAGLRLHLKTGGNEFYYAHLSRFAPGIKPGTRVKAGQLLGYSGSANGVAHLHIASRAGNPLRIFALGGPK